VRRLHLPHGRNFRLILLAQAITSVGDGIALVALAFAVLRFGGPSDLGWVLLGRQAAVVAAVIPGGAVADRFPRRNLIAASLVTRCLSQAGCAVVILAGHGSVAALLALQILYGVGSAFQWPAFAGFLPQLVGRDELYSANAWLSLARNGVAIVGPAVGGALVAFVGAAYGLAADAATFLVATAVVLATNVPESVRATRMSVLRDIRSGWGEFTSRTWLWTMTAAFALFNLFVLPAWLVLGPANVPGGAGSWGATLAVAGVGAILGSVMALGRRVTRALPLICVLNALYVIQLVALGARAPLVGICVTAFVGAAAFALGSAVWSTTFQADAPPDAISRLSSYTLIAYSVPTAVGFALVGPIADRIGAPAAFYGSALIGAVVCLLPLLAPSVRSAVPRTSVAADAAAS
jgi:MFS family permease